MLLRKWTLITKLDSILFMIFIISFGFQIPALKIIIPYDRAHINFHTTLYGATTIVNLLKERGKESLLVQAYQNYLPPLEKDYNISYIHFDLNKHRYILFYWVHIAYSLPKTML